MRITKDTPKLPEKAPGSKLKWQIEDYARCQEFRFHLPYPFLLLCKLWNKTPDDLLCDFMDNISCASWKREGRDTAKKFLHNYVLEMGYGQQYYPTEDIAKMFGELDNIGSLWPENAKMKMIEAHAKWRDEYYDWWFKAWHKKRRFLS
jgi:hypothetical protein